MFRVVNKQSNHRSLLLLLFIVISIPQLYFYVNNKTKIDLLACKQGVPVGLVERNFAHMEWWISTH